MPKPNQSKIKELKKLITNAKRKAKKPVIGKTNKSVTEMFRTIEAENLRRIGNNPQAKNASIANRLLIILKKAESGEFVASEMNRSADHLALNRIMVKINAFERQAKKVQLTDIEKKVFERYSRLLNDGPF